MFQTILTTTTLSFIRIIRSLGSSPASTVPTVCAATNKATCGSSTTWKPNVVMRVTRTAVESPIAQLSDDDVYPLGCSVDPVTGKLAVTNVFALSGGPGGRCRIPMRRERRSYIATRLFTICISAGTTIRGTSSSTGRHGRQLSLCRAAQGWHRVYRCHHWCDDIFCGKRSLGRGGTLPSAIRSMEGTGRVGDLSRHRCDRSG